MADLPENAEREYTLSASAARILGTAKTAPQWDLTNDRLLVPNVLAALPAPDEGAQEEGE